MTKRRRTPPDLNQRAFTITNAILNGNDVAKISKIADSEAAGLTHQQNAMMMSRVVGMLCAAIDTLRTNPRFAKEMRAAATAVSNASFAHIVSGGENRG